MKPQLFIILILLPLQLVAQNKKIDKAILSCRYAEEMVRDTLTRETFRDTIHLDIGAQYSAFYSQNLVKTDSLYSQPGGSRNVAMMIAAHVKETGTRPAFLQSSSGEYIYQGYPKGKTTVRARVHTNPVVIEEQRESPKWELCDSVTTIEGYECRQAVASFRGREWTAWYATEIPVSSGPWKLWGLPGLILWAHDTAHDYSYKLVSLEKPDDKDVLLLNIREYKYQKTTRLKYLQASASYTFGMSSREQASLTTAGSQVAEMFSNDVKVVHHDYRERDYRK